MHWLVTGRSGMGKGAIMKSIIIPQWRRRGVKVAVLDPLEMPGWNADFQTSDWEQFMAVVRNSRNIVTVIDEYGDYDYKAKMAIQWCATIARNFGQLHYAMAQRSMMVPPNVRNQCTNGIIFRQQEDDLAEIADLYDEPSLRLAHTFQPGQCMLLESLKAPVKMQVKLISKRKSLPTPTG